MPASNGTRRQCSATSWRNLGRTYCGAARFACRDSRPDFDCWARSWLERLIDNWLGKSYCYTFHAAVRHKLRIRLRVSRTFAEERISHTLLIDSSKNKLHATRSTWRVAEQQVCRADLGETLQEDHVARTQHEGGLSATPVNERPSAIEPAETCTCAPRRTLPSRLPGRPVRRNLCAASAPANRRSRGTRPCDGALFSQRI